VRFEWEGDLYEFLCLCSGLSLAPPVFTKLLKVPITLLRTLNIRYPSNGSVITRDINSPGHIDLLFQNLGFLINIEKSVLTPATKIEFLGMKVEVFLPQEKVDGIIDMCQDLLSFERASLRMITSGRKAVIPALLNYRFLQTQQIQGLPEIKK